MVENQEISRSRTRSRFHQLLSKESSKESIQNEEDALLSSPNKFLSKKLSDKFGNENQAFETEENYNADLLPKPKRRKSRQPDLKISVLTAESSFINVTENNPLDKTKGNTCAIDIEPEPSSSKEIEGSSRSKKGIQKLKKKQQPSKIVNEAQPDSKTEFEVSFNDDQEIFGITVHRTDRLSFDFFISHPMIKVYLVDATAGKLLQKSRSNRSVTSYYEGQTNNPVNYILPIMTQPYTPRQKSVLLPIWEETVVFNESFQYITRLEHSVVIFFELLDFISPSHPLFEIKRVADTGGWYCISWAFLKLRGSNGHLNTGHNVRLQLYKPASIGSKSDLNEIFKNWKYKNRLKYPGTLYVTVKSINIPTGIQPRHRSMLPLQPEAVSGSLSSPVDATIFSKSINEVVGSNSSLGLVESSIVWNRLPGQSCKVPKTKFHSIKGSNNGCFCLKFSFNGRFLASSSKFEESSTVLIYNVLSGCKEKSLNGHSGIIYDLDWSADDFLLLSASSDATVRIWDVHKEILHSLLPHPSYVYSAKFDPLSIEKESFIVATGCYDGILRIWSVSRYNSTNFNLLQELDGHTSMINSLLWESDRIFSGDGRGTIKIWSVKEKKKKDRSWTEKKSLNIKELQGKAINSLHISPTGSKLFVHSRGKYFVVIDLKLSLLIKKFEKPIGSNKFSQSCATPCGTLLFIPDERNLYAWSSITGELVHQYDNLPFMNPISCVTYHPLDHIISIASFGENSPLLIYNFIIEEKINSSLSELKNQVLDSSSPGRNIMVEKTTTVINPTEESERHHRLKMVVKKLDSVMSVVSQLKSSPVCAEETKNDFLDTEIADEKFSAVVNKLGELEIISETKVEYVPERKPRKKKKAKQDESLQAFN